jgi:hypothetical protein
MKFTCDANPRDNIEFTVDSGYLRIGITTEDTGFNEVIIDKRWAVELVKFLTENIGVEE